MVRTALKRLRALGLALLGALHSLRREIWTNRAAITWLNSKPDEKACLASEVGEEAGRLVGE